jgi:AcrR family transcriptional regulator
MILTMSTSSTRTAYHHGRLAEALLDAAAEVVSERGVAGMSLREVARRAGVSHAAPAHHFGDKAGLLTGVAREGFRRFVDALEAADEQGASLPPVDRLVEIGVAYVRFAAENPSYFAVMWRRDVQAVHDPSVLEFAAPAYDVLVRNVEAVASTGAWDGEDLSLVTLNCWSLVHGLSLLWLDGMLGPQVEIESDLEMLARRALTLFVPHA